MTLKRYVLIQMMVHGPLSVVGLMLLFAVVVFSFPFYDMTVPINRFLANQLGTWFPGVLYAWALFMFANCMGCLMALESGWDKEVFEAEK